ncbi:unnamed protein product [Boreogadus saida]
MHHSDIVENLTRQRVTNCKSRPTVPRPLSQLMMMARHYTRLGHSSSAQQGDTANFEYLRPHAPPGASRGKPISKSPRPGARLTQAGRPYRAGRMKRKAGTLDPCLGCPT